jgi:hypothetical protein
MFVLLGTSYPNATGNFLPHNEGVERKKRLLMSNCGILMIPYT